MNYHVLLFPQAQTDLESIYDYIAFRLLEQGTAARIYRELSAAIQSLDMFPSRNPLLGKEPWRSKGYRKLLIGNYLALYSVNESTKTVEVVKIIYAGRDIEKILTESIE